MKPVPFFQVDAFTERAFGGNPAAVVPLTTWLPDATLQAIAAENNLSETAFFVPLGPQPGRFHLRWFTPTTEVCLCGHATLASAWVVFHRIAPELAEVIFETLSGDLRVTQSTSSPSSGTSGRSSGTRAAALTLDFPASRLTPIAVTEALTAALGARPVEAFDGRDLLAIFPDAATVRSLRPELALVKTLHPHAVCISAPGTGDDADVDFVSRFFAPAMGVDEDPVTGSAHTHLTGFWAGRLGKPTLRARQVSSRAGELTVGLHGDRVTITGHAVLIIEGTLFLPS